MQNKDCDDNKENLSIVQEKHEQLRRTVLYFAGSIATLLIIGLVCYLIAKNGFTVESLLSTILAIFSIVISILFYFKADSTSSHFYDSSYNYMKDQSILLGRIEERFGAKFDSINTTLEHMHLKNYEIVEKETEKDLLIKEFQEKTLMSDKDKEAFINALKQKEQEIEELRKEKEEIQERVRTKIYDISPNQARELFANIAMTTSVEFLQNTLKTGKIEPVLISPKVFKVLYSNDIINNRGTINPRYRTMLFSAFKNALDDISEANNDNDLSI